MEVYLVGGAVRDRLLGLTDAERDWVVVGATPDEMQRAGFRAVGREFPVFLHPETHEEYALARLERKVAPGYRGFVAEFSPQVTLEQDLQRRDLTINAMAQRGDGTLIDPYGGAADLAARRLRHVAPAFVEDPVRILRVARFAARFADLGFEIAPETLALMSRMVAEGEADALVPERIWRELERALDTTHPEIFFEVLRACGALQRLLPEIAQVAPASDAFPLAALRTAAAQRQPAPVRWAALLADLDPATLQQLCERLRAPNEYRELALLAARLGKLLHGSGRALQTAANDPVWVMELLEAADAFRRPDRFAAWLGALQARAIAAGTPPPAIAALTGRLRSALLAAAGAKLSPADLRQHAGAELAARLRALRLAAIATT